MPIPGSTTNLNMPIKIRRLFDYLIEEMHHEEGKGFLMEPESETIIIGKDDGVVSQNLYLAFLGVNYSSVIANYYNVATNVDVPITEYVSSTPSGVVYATNGGGTYSQLCGAAAAGWFVYPMICIADSVPWFDTYQLCQPYQWVGPSNQINNFYAQPLNASLSEILLYAQIQNITSNGTPNVQWTANGVIYAAGNYSYPPQNGGNNFTNFSSNRCVNNSYSCPSSGTVTSINGVYNGLTIPIVYTPISSYTVLSGASIYAGIAFDFT